MAAATALRDTVDGLSRAKHAGRWAYAEATCTCEYRETKRYCDGACSTCDSLAQFRADEMAEGGVR